MALDGIAWECEPKMNCKHCKWWNQDKPNNSGVCELASGADDGPEHKQALAFASAGPDATAWLITSGDFGCVQFEAKQAS